MQGKVGTNGPLFTFSPLALLLSTVETSNLAWMMLEHLVCRKYSQTLTYLLTFQNIIAKNIVAHWSPHPKQWGPMGHPPYHVFYRSFYGNAGIFLNSYTPTTSTYCFQMSATTHKIFCLDWGPMGHGDQWAIRIRNVQVPGGPLVPMVGGPLVPTTHKKFIAIFFLSCLNPVTSGAQRVSINNVPKVMECSKDAQCNYSNRKMNLNKRQKNYRRQSKTDFLGFSR